MSHEQAFNASLLAKKKDARVEADEDEAGAGAGGWLQPGRAVRRGGAGDDHDNDSDNDNDE